MPRILCDYCQIPIDRPQCHIKRTKKHFCSYTCMGSNKTTDPFMRFWAKVDKQTCLGNICGCHKGLGHCWPWIGKKFKSGYGQFQAESKKTVRAHRWIYEQERGPLLPKFLVCHQCDNKPCCNVDHMNFGTPTDNIRDAILRGHLPALKVTDDEVVIIRSLKGQIPKVVVAERFHITPSYVWAIWQNKVRKERAYIS